MHELELFCESPSSTSSTSAGGLATAASVMVCLGVRWLGESRRGLSLDCAWKIG